jgi:hypothetical protein
MIFCQLGARSLNINFDGAIHDKVETSLALARTLFLVLANEILFRTESFNYYLIYVL